MRSYSALREGVARGGGAGRRGGAPAGRGAGLGCQQCQGSGPAFADAPEEPLAALRGPLAPRRATEPPLGLRRSRPAAKAGEGQPAPGGRALPPSPAVLPERGRVALLRPVGA